MRSRVGQWIVCAFWAAWPWQQLHSQERSEPWRVARLVERLGDASFSERDAASNELALLGSAARQELEAALDSPDVEVRIRARKLIELLAIEELWAGSLFEPPVGPRSSRAMFDSLARQTGNRLLLGERFAGIPEGPVSLASSAVWFWPAMDEICGQIDCRFRAHYELLSPGLAIVAGRRGQNPLAYAGPFRAQLTSARRLFQEDLDYATADREREHLFQVQLELIWEDRFNLVAHRAQPVVVRAVTDDGQRISSEQPSGGAWSVVSAGGHQTSATLRLHPPPVRATRLAELTLAWELIAVGDFATVELDPRQDRAAHFQDDAAITVSDCRIESSGRVEIDLSMARDMPIPEPQDIVFQENRIALLDADGKLFRKHGQSHALTMDGAQYKLTFIGPSPDSVPARLRVKYPRIRSRRTVELAFRDVPLPCDRPE